jgi:hypothetical protein
VKKKYVCRICGNPFKTLKAGLDHIEHKHGAVLANYEQLKQG